jgi:hypothetical protein
LVLLNIVSGMLMAQFSVGLQGGANLSRMDFTNNQDYRFTEIDYQQGFTAGLVLQFLGEKHTGVQAEFNYSRRGWVENDTTGAEYFRYRNTMDYLEMPILSHINIGGGRFRGIFNIGPYLGYALNRKITTENVDRGTEQTEDYAFESKRDNQFDFGLLVGGGIEYRFSFGKISAEARYTIGLGDINKQKVFQSELSQFRIISVLVRYTIPLSKRAVTPEKTVQ